MGDEEDPQNGESYYLRSKRRRVDVGEKATCSHSNQNTWRRKNPIMHIPLEVLQNVFKFITNRELSERVRFVNRKFKLAAEDLLNKTFKGFPKKLQGLTRTTFQAIEMTADDMEMKCLCRLLNILDIISFQHTVIMATIWRYVYNDFYRNPRCCMYAGQIVDLYEDFLLKFKTKPYQVYGPSVAKDYALPEDVKLIIHLTKSFCIHFDKISEEPIKHALKVSGCKIVDLLDCASFATKNVISESVTGNSFSAKYSYYLQNAWFVAFSIPPEKPMTEKQKQRMMHMRIRRIILAHTEMYMQQSQYDRELLLRIEPVVVKKPSVVVYTGYGDVHDTFFCYGSMNDAAYLQKFNLLMDEHNDEDNEEEFQEMLPVMEDLEQRPSDNSLFVPHLGLEIDIKIDCPLAYAPAKFIKENGELTTTNEHENSSGMFNMQITFNFPGAYYTRLPPRFDFHKRISTRH